MVSALKEECNKINECTDKLYGIENRLSDEEYNILITELDKISSKMIELKLDYWYQKL